MISKRLVSLLLSAVTVVSLASCGKSTKRPTPTPLPTPGVTVPVVTPTEEPTPDVPTLPAITLSEEDKKLFENSYNILLDRITDRGYAITSLTGTYVGMFTRDSAIQAMAHLAYGDPDAARAILKYLLSYHATLGLDHGTHIIDNLKDTEYRNNYLNTSDHSPSLYYEEQTVEGSAQFLINAPNNASATPFVTKKRSVNCVQAYLEGAKSAKVVAEIYTDLYDPNTLVGSGSYTFDSTKAGWKRIALDKDITLNPDTTYYLKLYAPEGSGRVVWYGVSSAGAGARKAHNYDLSAYGGNGWREVGVYTAFIIGDNDASAASSHKIAQRNAESGIYLLNAPNNGGAQPFVPKNDRIYGVEVNLTKTGNNDTVRVKICTDYKDPASAIAETTYTFGTAPNGWQMIAFDSPVTVTPGQKYYLVVQATADSGRVVWNGTTGGAGNLNSFSYDVPAFGGWAEKPYYPAYEILSFPANTVAKGFESRGNSASQIDLTLFAPTAKGKVIAEIRRDFADPDSTVASISADITKAGTASYSLHFDTDIALAYQEYYYLVIRLEGADAGTRVCTDTESVADTYAKDEHWMPIGYDLQAEVVSGVDKTPLITLDGKTAGVQEIPTSGEIITAVKLLLSKDKGAQGKLRATLYQGNGRNKKKIDSKIVDFSAISENADWLLIQFELPLFKPDKKENYFVHIETENADGNVYWCGSKTIDRLGTFAETEGKQTKVDGEAGFEALKSEVKLISNYTQTDANYMLIHAWVMYVNQNGGSAEDKEFIEASYPIIRQFANYYIDSPTYFNKQMNLIFNQSLEHSRKIRYWQSYDLLTNVFASQALYELSAVATSLADTEMATKWLKYAHLVENGINKNLVTEYDGKKIYGEFYDVEDNMKFYAGISWINFAPVAAEWYGMDTQIMQNTYEVYKKFAGIQMYGSKCLATEATLGTKELTRELIGKGIAWELMFCQMIGDTERMAEIVKMELATAKKNNISVYPEFWKSESYVTDPGNQEHCSWQCYAMAKAFPQLLSE